MATTLNSMPAPVGFPKFAKRRSGVAKSFDDCVDGRVAAFDEEPARPSASGIRASDAESSSIDLSPQSATEIDFAELKDGTLVDLVEDPIHSGRVSLAIWKDGQIEFTNRLERDGRAFVPCSRNDGVLGSLRLPKAVMPYGSVQELLRRLESLISECIAVDEKYVSVLADFVLSTWFVDRVLVTPYISVVGLPQSGKTTLVRVLRLVCRRSLLLSDITSASLYRACARFTPTVLIDETATVANDRTLRHILRTGITRDTVAVRRNQAFHSYGAKVTSWLEPSNDPALNSRCIVIPMFESESTALVRTEEPAVQQLASDLQAQLLQFRFENYKKVQVVPVPGEESLRPRTRDLLRSLCAAHGDPGRSQRLLRFFEAGQGVQAEPLDPEQNAVLRALFSTVHIREDFTTIWIKDLAKQVNFFLDLEGERLRLQPRKVGSVLTALGFSSRTRTNSGWTMSVSQRDVEKIHQLVASYGVDGAERSLRGISPINCKHCRAVGIDKMDLPPAPEGTTRKEVDLCRPSNARIG